MTLATLLPIPGAAKILLSYAFEEREDGGTHFEFRVAMPKPKDLPFYEQIWPTVHGNYNTGFQTLRQMLEENAGSPPVVEEPPVPMSAERFLTEPVHALWARFSGDEGRVAFEFGEPGAARQGAACRAVRSTDGSLR